MKSSILRLLSLILLFTLALTTQAQKETDDRPHVIVATDAEIDDECSLVRLLLYLNDIDVEAIVTTSSQYHAHDHKWAGDDWYKPYVKAYAEVYPNLIQHDARYPKPEQMAQLFCQGNVKTEGDMQEETEGSRRIVETLLDHSDPRPVWILHWGGICTTSRALKTIEEQHPEEMAYVAQKLRLYCIWEQDATYQSYIRPHWGKYNILTIVSDQYINWFYYWYQYLPEAQQQVLRSDWMKRNILEGHGALCSLYKANDDGSFRSEGDSPSYFHVIPTGLRSETSPGWGGWGGRFRLVRENTWLDPVNEPGYVYPEGRWWTKNGWGREELRKQIPHDSLLVDYLRPSWRWTIALQNEFAARADWCVKDYKHANHEPVVKCNLKDVEARPGQTLKLSAKGTFDPDKDQLTYHWWQYTEAGTCPQALQIASPDKQDTRITIPRDAQPGTTIHLILEVTDNGTPTLVRYARVVITILTE